MLFKKSPGIKNKNRERYESVKKHMWVKCDSCGKLVYYKDYIDNLRICPKCGHTFPLTPKQRFDLLFDNKKWEELKAPVVTDDPLTFVDRVPYKDRLAEARAETGKTDAITFADGAVGGVGTTICVLNGEFMMGSMGRAAGDGIIAAAEHAVANRHAMVMVVASGGARMQENILSLMQMPRSVVAVNKLRDARLPYIVLLTDPTYGGVTASFAMLGDIHIAEAGARIGFAGRRVIEQNMREKLPSNFQTAEYLLEHGMVDIVSKRADLKQTLDGILGVLMKQKRAAGPVAAMGQPKIETTHESKSKTTKKSNSTAAYDKVLLARNENRPHFLDYIAGMVSEWTPLAGDRLFGEDAAMQSGLGFFRGIPSVVIGQEKGRDIATRQKYRFGMPTPEGYRKAARMMRLAEKFELPIISLVDTDGAFAGREGEERGQSEAVASSIQTGLSVATPYVSVIVGTGGSGGAVAIATGDKILMLENAIYSVIAPESCASILWKDNKYRAEAAAAMKLTARDMYDLAVIDKIVPEPSGGAHTDWQATMEHLGDAVVAAIKEIEKTPAAELPRTRADKFLTMTRDVGC